MTDYPVNAPTISYGSSLKKDYRTLSADFGDGYNQRTGDGLNTLNEAWSLQWNTITLSEKNILINFFDSLEGYQNFNWTAPGDGVAKRWICKSPVITPLNSTYFNVTAVFERVYDL